MAQVRKTKFRVGTIEGLQVVSKGTQKKDGKESTNKDTKEKTSRS